MTGSPELLGLLRQLEDADTPLERLRMLALGWRSVRSLGPAERAQLAARLGTEGADQLVEKLARRKGGIAPTVLLEAVHAARAADPGKLRGLLSSLRDGEQRAQVVKDGLKAVGERVLSGLTETGAIPYTESAPAPLPPIPPTAEPPIPAAAPSPEPAQTELLHEPDEEDDHQAPTPENLVAAEPPPEVVEHETVAPIAAPEPSLKEVDDTETSPLPAIAEQPSTVDSSAVVAAVTRGRNPAERLRALRGHGRRLAGLGSHEVHAIVDSFPQGWPRRRALVSLFTAGAPQSHATALELIRKLEHDRDRTWCLSALLGSRALDEETLAAALEIVDSASTRRRLRERAHR